MGRIFFKTNFESLIYISFLIITFLFLIHSSCLGKSELKTDVMNITVDYSSETGRINKNIYGILSNPDEHERKWKPIKEAGFKLIQVGVLTDDEIISRVNKNPNELKELPFIKLLDLYIQKIYEIDAEPMIWFLCQDRPIRDLKAFSLYTKYIIKHITEAFAGGGKWPVKIFRFGNEPDNPEYWKGTPEQYYEMFTVWAKTVKEMNPDFVIVGPSIVSAIELGRGNINSSKVNRWTMDFLAYLEKHRCPLDFFTFHAYGPVIYDVFYKQTLTVSNELKKHSTLSPLYGIPKIGNDEWNVFVGDQWSGRYHREFDTVSLAAHNIAALIAMIEGGLELSIRYGGVDSPGHDYVMINKDFRYKPVYYAFKGFNTLLLPTPIKLLTRGSNWLNSAALACKSEDGNEITVAISSFDVDQYYEQYILKEGNSDPLRREVESRFFKSALRTLNLQNPSKYKTFDLEILKLDWKESDKVEYKLFVTDEKSNFELRETKFINGGKKLFISESLETPSVQIINLKRLQKRK